MSDPGDSKPFNPWQSPREVTDDEPASDAEASVPWYRLENGIGWLMMASAIVPPAAVAVSVICFSGPIFVSFGGRPVRPRQTWPAARNVLAVLLAWLLASPCCGAWGLVLGPLVALGLGWND